jgi:glycosyltransferase involved in cell wall biosynthesis
VTSFDFAEYKGYSVLMAVWYKERPEYLQQAIESLQAQTLPTRDFVLVCDGPLGEALEAVIEAKQQEMGPVLKVIRLEENGGLGKALKAGLKHCECNLVARMDSDDIAYPERCEKQVEVFNKYRDISICSGVVEEFSTSPNCVEARRVLPETNAEIVKFARTRCPFNHPCVMYKKSAVEAVGSYEDFYLLEDYYLWLRMLMAGYKGYNLQVPLLHMRAGSAMYLRRSGFKYAKSQVRLLKFMRRRGFIGPWQYMAGCVARCGAAVVPNWLRHLVFGKMLRK